VDGGAEGVLIKGTALAEQGGARLASFGEGLVLLQPAQQAADVGLVPLVEAEFVILLERKRGRAGIGEAEHPPVGEPNVAGKQLQRVRRQVVGAEEFAVIEEGLDVLQQVLGGDRGALRVGHPRLQVRRIGRRDATPANQQRRRNSRSSRWALRPDCAGVVAHTMIRKLRGWARVANNVGVNTPTPSWNAPSSAVQASAKKRSPGFRVQVFRGDRYCPPAISPACAERLTTPSRRDGTPDA